MSPADSQRITDIFSEALELAPADRSEFLSRHPEFRAEVEAMLFAESHGQVLLQPLPTELPGGWKLFEEIAQGDIGKVYRAMRAADGFTQVAAVKILPYANLTAERVRRLVLAKLQHPNIAQVLDGGSCKGIPFLAMELVDKGQPMVEYCATLPIRERLLVFLKICGGVQYAHQHLIVDCHIKSSNILVNAEGEPKLLDFGIARMLEPEPATTSTDVCSLGTLLFEILTGGTSKDAKSIPADLDAIVQKATRAEAPARYSSVEQFSADIQRYLDGHPVQARAGTWQYIASKWVARHKLGAAVSAVLLVGAVAFVWEAAQTAGARTLAEGQLRETREIAGMMALQVPQQLATVAGSLPLRRKMVQLGLAHLDQLLADRDPNDRKQRRQLAMGYFNIANALGGPNTANVGDFAGATQCYRKAIDLLWEDSASLPRDAGVLAAMRFSHGRMIGDLRRLRRMPEALKSAEDCIVKAPQIGDDTADAVALGCRFQRLQILTEMGNPSVDTEAEAILNASLKRAEDAEFAVGTVNSEVRLTRLYLEKKEYQKAIEHAKVGLDTAPKNRNPEVSILKGRLMGIAALAEFRSGSADAARFRFDECFDLLRELVRREPTDVESRTELARALFESLETIPDDVRLHHARMVEAESLAQSLVKDVFYPEGRFLLVQILARQADLQNNDCALRQKALDEYQKLVDAKLNLPSDKPIVDEIRAKQCGKS